MITPDAPKPLALRVIRINSVMAIICVIGLEVRVIKTNKVIMESRLIKIIGLLIRMT